MMFTDEDLKRFSDFINGHGLLAGIDHADKEKLSIPRGLLQALLARLEAAERLINYLPNQYPTVISVSFGKELYEAWRKAARK